jgi:hypothetical protein
LLDNRAWRAPLIKGVGCLVVLCLLDLGVFFGVLSDGEATVFLGEIRAAAAAAGDRRGNQRGLQEDVSLPAFPGSLPAGGFVVPG